MKDPTNDSIKLNKVFQSITDQKQIDMAIQYANLFQRKYNLTIPKMYQYFPSIKSVMSILKASREKEQFPELVASLVK